MADNIYNVCLIRKYNNYFNRIIKGFSTLAEYISNIDPDDIFLYEKTINFSFEDNVSTELIMNDCPFAADYLLLLEANGAINSRWFVMEEIYTRNKQRKYVLRRDVVFDFKDKLLSSSAFIQKAMLSDDDSFIFNSEGMSFNQVKKSETLLKDVSRCAWIVGYIAKNAAPTDITISVPDEDFEYKTINDIATAMGVSEGDLASLLNFDSSNTNEARFTNSVQFRYFWNSGQTFSVDQWNRDKYKPDFSAKISLAHEPAPFNTETVLFQASYGINFQNYFVDAVIAHKASILASMSSITSRVYLTSNQLEILRTFLNTPIYYNGEYYTLSLSITGAQDEPRIGYSAITTWPAIKAAFDDAVSAYPGSLHVVNNGELAIFTNSTVVYIHLDKISDIAGVISGITTKISSARRVVANQVFDMFAIPYGELNVIGDQMFNTKAESALTIAAAIAKELDTACYDIQLLPYCPITDIVNGISVDLTGLTEDKEFNYISKTNTTVRQLKMSLINRVYPDAGSSTGYYAEIIFQVNKAAADITGAGIEGPLFESSTYTLTVIDASTTEITITAETHLTSNPGSFFFPYYEYNGYERYSVIFWANKNSFSRILNYSLALKDSVKVESECNKYRLVSPNYQGSFDFNVAKNGGKVDYFIAECTYKPYTPYLKIAPAFDYLYGTNFGDCRGLICGGDFSLPRFSSAWENYELNNKNYQNIFNREIQNLDFEQNLNMRESLITGGLGIITSGAIGAGAGAKVGGGYGAIAGAIIGTAVSAVGYAADIDILGQRQREQKAFAIDKFNYQLGNIKALPYTITKVGSFDINSKIWPFLEYYTCTDEEKTALLNKIEYESMTVMRVGIIGEYIGVERHYLKCELIRNEEIAEDNHIFEALYNELAKGVYI